MVQYLAKSNSITMCYLRLVRRYSALTTVLKAQFVENGVLGVLEC